MGVINAIFIAIMAFSLDFTAIGVMAIIWAVLALMINAENAKEERRRKNA
jgi:hypothetical protein